MGIKRHRPETIVRMDQEPVMHATAFPFCWDLMIHQCPKMATE